MLINKEMHELIERTRLYALGNAESFKDSIYVLSGGIITHSLGIIQYQTKKNITYKKTKPNKSMIIDVIMEDFKFSLLILSFMSYSL